jgi:hypothetical protein
MTNSETDPTQRANLMSLYVEAIENALGFPLDEVERAFPQMATSLGFRERLSYGLVEFYREAAYADYVTRFPETDHVVADTLGWLAPDTDRQRMTPQRDDLTELGFDKSGFDDPIKLALGMDTGFRRRLLDPLVSADRLIVSDPLARRVARLGTAEGTSGIEPANFHAWDAFDLMRIQATLMHLAKLKVLIAEEILVLVPMRPELLQLRYPDARQEATELSALAERIVDLRFPELAAGSWFSQRIRGAVHEESLHKLHLRWQVEAFLKHAHVFPATIPLAEGAVGFDRFVDFGVGSAQAIAKLLSPDAIQRHFAGLSGGTIKEVRPCSILFDQVTLDADRVTTQDMISIRRSDFYFANLRSALRNFSSSIEVASSLGPVTSDDVARALADSMADFQSDATRLQTGGTMLELWRDRAKRAGLAFLGVVVPGMYAAENVDVMLLAGGLAALLAAYDGKSHSATGKSIAAHIAGIGPLPDGTPRANSSAVSFAL